MTFRINVLILVIILIPLTVSSSGQEQYYDELFGNDWKEALQFLEKNDSWIREALKKHELTYPVTVSIVFPELVRYSALRDKLETTMLKTLYRNLGADYADFSIGVFQVKPSFAEKIREESRSLSGWRMRNMFRKSSSYKNIREYRSAIIADLEDPVSEFNYIIAFFKICEKYFSVEFPDEETKIIFLATAYNTGFWKSKEEIEKMTGMKFYNTKLFSTENYSYADVSLFWYKKYFQIN